MKIVKGKAAKRVLILAAVVLVIVAVCAGYLGDYYRADTEQIESFLAESGDTVCREEPGCLVFGPEDAEAGLIFYPGGKVEHTAYVPLMDLLADRGILCVLVEMPFRLAVLNPDAAEGIPERYPGVESWYIGGHSLGGSMAASHLAKHPEVYRGLVLLGSYSTADLSGTGLSVLSVYGSEDRVMNREKYDGNLQNLPEDLTELVLDGGCHAYFGMYGPQDGDGTPRMTNREQLQATADAIAAMIADPAA